MLAVFLGSSNHPYRSWHRNLDSRQQMGTPKVAMSSLFHSRKSVHPSNVAHMVVGQAAFSMRHPSSTSKYNYPHHQPDRVRMVPSRLCRQSRPTDSACSSFAHEPSLSQVSAVSLVTFALACVTNIDCQDFGARHVSNFCFSPAFFYAP